MRIGIFTDCYYPQINGVVTSIRLLEDELKRLGHDVTIITVDVPNHIDTNNNIIRIKSLPFIRWKEFRIGLPIYTDPYKQIKQLDLDIIHTHTEFSIGLLGKHMAKALDIPIVHTYHTMYEDYTHYIYNLKYGKSVVRKFIINTSKNYVKTYDGIIAPSQKTKQALESYGVKTPIYTIPTGIEVSRFQNIRKDNPRVSELRQRYDLDPDKKIILSLGRISEEKSVDVILNQMPSLLKAQPNSQLLIVGDGPYMEHILQVTRDLNIEEYVVFTGSIPYDDVPYYYALADVFVSASKTETQGLTIFEAMASSCPVIVYDDSNIDGIVIDYYSGRRFNTEDDLLQTLTETLSQPEKADSMAQNGALILASLSQKHFGLRIESMYQHLIQERSTAFPLKLNA